MSYQLVLAQITITLMFGHEEQAHINFMIISWLLVER